MSNQTLSLIPFRDANNIVPQLYEKGDFKANVNMGEC